jgi:hypothetical protein
LDENHTVTFKAFEVVHGNGVDVIGLKLGEVFDMYRRHQDDWLETLVSEPCGGIDRELHKFIPIPIPKDLHLAGHNPKRAAVTDLEVSLNLINDSLTVAQVDDQADVVGLL